MSRTRSRLDAAGPDERADLLDLVAGQAAAGDLDAASDLAWAILRFRLARPAIRRFLLRADEIELAEQQTLVSVAARISSFRGEARFTTWLTTVAANEARQYLRAERRHRDRTDDEPVDEHADQFVARVSSMIANHALVRQAIERLTPDHRTALALREEHGLTYDEIAGRLDVPLSTAKTRVRRARTALAADLIDALGDEHDAGATRPQPPEAPRPTSQ